MFVGMFVSTVGASMIWPFLMIYVSGKLHLPLTDVAFLLTINAATGFVSSFFIAGPLTDRVGRKGVMVVSLMVNGLYYVLMAQAETLSAFRWLMVLSGAFNPLYRVGGDAMLADLIPPEKRPDAYALLRLSNNVGVAIGPAAGGFIASASYSIAFGLGAVGMCAYGLLLAILARETLPERPASLRPAAGWLASQSMLVELLRGYWRIIRDLPFISFTGAFTLNWMTAVLMWVLMGVYAKQNFGVPENQYGWIPTTNAMMVVLFQVLITARTKRYPPLWVMALGALFYALGAGSVSLAVGYWGFWSAMVIMTLGELILVPTSSTYVANLAPVDMRGRYMSIYGLTWPIAQGIAPVIGGFLNDHYGPVTIWYGGMAIGLFSALAFAVLARCAPGPVSFQPAHDSLPTTEAE